MNAEAATLVSRAYEMAQRLYSRMFVMCELPASEWGRIELVGGVLDRHGVRHRVELAPVDFAMHLALALRALHADVGDENTADLRDMMNGLYAHIFIHHESPRPIYQWPRLHLRDIAARTHDGRMVEQAVLVEPYRMLDIIVHRLGSLDSARRVA